MANKKHIRLNSARDVHKLLSKMINERRRCEVDSQECRDIGYLAKILLDSLKAVELEGRIENLEKPQKLEIKFPVHSEQDEKLIISYLRKIELGLLPSASETEQKGEIIELISDESDN